MTFERINLLAGLRHLIIRATVAGEPEIARALDDVRISYTSRWKHEPACGHAGTTTTCPICLPLPRD